MICLTTLSIYDTIQHGLTICTTFAIAREQDVYFTLMKLKHNIEITVRRTTVLRRKLYAVPAKKNVSEFGSILLSLHRQIHHILYIGRAYPYSPNVAFYIFFSTTISTEYFKHAANSPFFSSKCHLFHNAAFFGSCIIHILHTGCDKI